MFPLFLVLHQPVIRRLSGGLVRHPRHHQTAERRRCARPLQCDVIDDTIKLLNDHAALEVFVCIIVALVAVVSCVRKTLHEHEAITTPSPMPGQAALRRESGCSHRCPGRVLVRLSLHRRAVGRCRCVSIIAGPSVIRKLARHMTFASMPSLIYDRYLRSCARLRRGAAAACWRPAWGAQALKAHATNSLLHLFFWHHSVMRAVISLRFTRVLRCVL